MQPRIDLGRSFDQRYHSYLGYVLFARGEAGGEAREFSVRIGSGAQAKHAFRAGDRVSGAARPVLDPERETADLYKASALKLTLERTGTLSETLDALEAARGDANARVKTACEAALLVLRK